MSERERGREGGPHCNWTSAHRNWSSAHCKWNNAQCNWGWTPPCALVCARPREKKKEEKICSAVAAGWGNPVAAQTRPQRTAISTALSPLLPVVLIQRRAEVTAPLCCAPPGPRRNRRRNARPPSLFLLPHSPLLLSLCRRKFALALIVFWPVDSPVLYCHTLLYFKNTHCCRGRFLVLSIPQTGPRAGRWRQRPERTCSPYPPRWPLSFPVTVEFSLCLPQRGSPPA